MRFERGNSAANQETLADIVAAMRSGKLSATVECEKCGDEHERRFTFNGLADHIEAAWKRQMYQSWHHREMEELIAKHEKEIAELKKQTGNAAALREALVAVKKSIDGIGASSLDCDPTILMAALTQVCARLSARIERALSAPARNCDIMSRSTCTKHFSTIYEGNRDGLCDVQTEREKNIHLYYIEFNKWLFAPAAERKGEEPCTRAMDATI